jgi:HEAT repeat protein
MPDKDRLVEIRAPRAGSGYLVTDRLVLTALHVIRPPTGEAPPLKVCVRLEGRIPRGSTPSDAEDLARVLWPVEPCDSDDDFALLLLDTPFSTDPARWAPLDEDAGRLKLRAIGYPDVAIDKTLMRRDTKGVEGWTDLGDGIRKRKQRRGTFTLRLIDEDQPPGNPADAWPAMSGAPVFAGETLVGIIRLADKQGQRGVLEALPVDRLFERADVIEALRGESCALPHRVDGYTAQAPEDVKATRAVLGWVVESCGTVSFLGKPDHADDMAERFRDRTVRGRVSDGQEPQLQSEPAIQQALGDISRDGPTTIGARKEPAEQERSDINAPAEPLEERVAAHWRNTGATRGLLLVAEPGGGKSTALKNIAWRIAQRKSPFANERRLPVFVSLADWGRRADGTHPFDRFLSEMRFGITRPDWPREPRWWLDQLQRGGVFLCLDGLEYLRPGSPAEQTLAVAIPDWLRAGNRIIITCRTGSESGYRLGGSFECLTLNGFTLPEQESFVRHHPCAGSFDQAVLLQRLRDDDKVVQKLAANPFMLDVLCFLAKQDHSKAGQLPKTRSAILRSAVTEILKATVLSPDSVLELSPKYLRNVLARAALRLSLREPVDRAARYHFSRQEMLDCVREAVAAEGGAQPGKPVQLLDFYQATRLINLPYDSAAWSEVGGSFVHTLFHEWLAAAGIALHVGSGGWSLPFVTERKAGSKASCAQRLVEELVFQPQWREILTFLPSLLPSPTEFFEQQRDLSDDLTRTRLTLLLRALAELPEETAEDRERLQSVQSVAESVGQSAWTLLKSHWRASTAALVPELVSLEPLLPRFAPQILKNLGDDLCSSKVAQRMEALRAIARLRSNSAELLSQVAENNGLHHADPILRKLAGVALASMAEAGLGKLEEALRSDDWTIQISAAETVADLGVAAAALPWPSGVSTLVTHLIKLTLADQVLVRASGCQVLGLLGAVGAQTESVVEALLKCALGDPAPAVRARAIQALGRPELREGCNPHVLNVLVDSLNPVNMSARKADTLRLAATVALRAIAPQWQSAQRSHVLDRLMRLSQSPLERTVLGSLCEALILLGPPESLPPWDQAIRLIVDAERQPGDPHDTPDFTRVSASEAILRLDLQLSGVDPYASMMSALTSEDGAIRTRAAAAVKSFKTATPAQDKMLQAVRGLLTSKRWYCRATAAEILGQLGLHKDQDTAVRAELFSALSQVLPDEDHPIAQGKILEALGRIGSSSFLDARIVKIILENLHNHEDWYRTTLTCEALSLQLPVQDKKRDEIVAKLLECLGAPDWCIRTSACAALGRVGCYPGNDKALKGLWEALGDPQQPVRVAASEALSTLIGGSDGARLISEGARSNIKLSGSDIRASVRLPVAGMPDYLTRQLPPFASGHRGPRAARHGRLRARPAQ